MEKPTIPKIDALAILGFFGISFTNIPTKLRIWAAFLGLIFVIHKVLGWLFSSAPAAAQPFIKWLLHVRITNPPGQNCDVHSNWVKVEGTAWFRPKGNLSMAAFHDSDIGLYPQEPIHWISRWRWETKISIDRTKQHVSRIIIVKCSKDVQILFPYYRAIYDRLEKWEPIPRELAVKPGFQELAHINVRLV